MNSPGYEAVRKLSGTGAVESFDCGQPALNQFLQRFALVNQKSNSAQTYVCCHSGVVVGFYSLAVGSVEPATAAPRVVKGIPRHPVPVMILARLAVNLGHQGVRPWQGSSQGRVEAHRPSGRYRRNTCPADAREGRCRAPVVPQLGVRAKCLRPVSPVPLDEGHQGHGEASTPCHTCLHTVEFPIRISQRR